MSHLDEINLWLEERTPHIFGLNETRLDSSITDEDLHSEA